MGRFTSMIVSAVLIATSATLVAATAVAQPGTDPPGPPPLPGPPAVSHDGTYTVGTDVIAGVYASGGPAGTGTCYWKRVGADNITLANALTKQPQVVVIEPTDVAFKTNGCQPWLPTDAAPPGQTPPWLSQLQLRHSLDVLNGLAGQSGNGQLPPY